jgi:hypothetical protein
VESEEEEKEGKKMVINSKGMEEITNAIRYLEVVVEITEKHHEQFNWESMEKIVDGIKNLEDAKINMQMNWNTEEIADLLRLLLETKQSIEAIREIQKKLVTGYYEAVGTLDAENKYKNIWNEKVV